MTDTTWWDTCIVSVRWGEQGWQVRAGVFCIALVGWLALGLLRRLVHKDRAE